MKKLNLIILMGGRSAEHEISLLSAKNIVSTLDKEKYTITLVGIDKNGTWHLLDNEDYLINPTDPKTIALKALPQKVAILPYPNRPMLIESAVGKCIIEHIDAVFPVLHGTYGEDGTIQGYLELAGISYVGADVLGSSIGMDKVIMKRLLKEAKIPSPAFLSFFKRDKILYTKITKKLGSTIFIKPANLGSSVGISKVKNELEFTKAVELAFRYDHKIIIEQAIEGREIEISVLGNENPKASLLGEIIPQNYEFYSYEAKYIDDAGARLDIPAKLSLAEIAACKKIAIKAYSSLSCSGMARVDMFLDKNSQKFLINEINTIPGFTKISMYPKLWEVSGLSYSQLLDELIQLAIERKQAKEKLIFSYS